MNAIKSQVLQWIARSKTEEDLLYILIAYTQIARAQTDKPARFQEAALHYIQEIAIENGRVVEDDPSLGDTIMSQQHRKIIQWGNKTFCLSISQMAVVIKENWPFLKKTGDENLIKKTVSREGENNE